MFKNKKNIKIYDPVINPKDLKELKLKFTNLKKGFKNSDVAIILNNHKSYLDIDIYSLIKSMKKPSIFIDTWHIFNLSEIKQLKGVLYGDRSKLMRKKFIPIANPSIGEAEAQKVYSVVKRGLD